MSKKVLVIGSGLGALSTALRLSTRGYQVEIVEKHNRAGGRLNLLQKDGFTFDVGPSFFSMSYEFTELFKDCGVANPLELEELDPVYSVQFAHRSKPFYIYKDFARLAKEFDGLETDFEKKLRKYIDTAKVLFHDTEDIVIRRNFGSKLDYLYQLTKVPWKHAPMMFRSMWKELDGIFSSEEAKVIFSLVAFFLGSTPFQTPAVYSLLNYTELEHDGYWNVKGGMYKIVEELVKLLEARGVRIHYGVEIVEAEQSEGRVSAFIDRQGHRWSADLFVCNSDAAAFRGTVLKRPRYSIERLDRMDWTLSPFTIYLGVKGKVDNLIHHNYFLGSNFKQYADTIFKTSVSPEKPYYYVNVSSKSNPRSAPDGCENIFILCPVPDLRYKPDWSDAEKLTDTILDDMTKRTGFDFKANRLTQTIMTPVEWKDTFNLYRGSGLGLAHGLNQVGGFRPSNKDEEFRNLYYVGASTTPGTGLPMVVISSRLAVDRITREHGPVHADLV